MKKILSTAAVILFSSSLLGCDDAQIANQNLSKAADNFEIMRNIVFYNTWSDTEIMSITGYCSLSPRGSAKGQSRLWVTCKDADGIKRHQLGLSGQVTYFMAQIESVDVSLFHTRITWKPEAFIPDIDLRTSLSN